MNELAEYNDRERVYSTHPGKPRYLTRDYQYLFHKVRYETLGKDLYGWQINTERAARVDVIEKGIQLRRVGHIHRKNPVPGTGRYTNCIHKRTIHGLSHEHRSNDVCQSEYPEYNLIRPKRRHDIRGYVYWDFRDHHFNSQRGWKRSKKRKQYM